MNFRGRWEVSSRDLHDSQIITMVPSDRGFMDPDYNCYPSRSTLYYRSVAIIFMTLFILRHFLPLMVGEVEDEFTAPFSLLVLRVGGILIPIVVLARVLCIFQRRRQLHGARNVAVPDEESLSSVSLPDEESLSSVSIYQSQPHVVRVC
ncbi:uncharacterized protein A4U43_C06F6820 [Asparagus officinalis]|uniref:Uncharacterized protein n=2 Tax=Asparagus officinalis TaxID=4686 RepID=A0A5P1EQQ2_ASPOF|nr:uncharacterized protein A4U43_C06F6820 [Asparagus officinalis]